MKHARASSSGFRLGIAQPRLDVSLGVDQELGGRARPWTRHASASRSTYSRRDQVDHVLGQPGVVARDAAVGQAVRGLAEEPRRPSRGSPRVARDRAPRSGARPCRRACRASPSGSAHDQQVERRVGAEDRRLRGVVAGDVAGPERRSPGAAEPRASAAAQKRSRRAGTPGRRPRCPWACGCIVFGPAAIRYTPI